MATSKTLTPSSQTLLDRILAWVVDPSQDTIAGKEVVEGEEVLARHGTTIVHCT